MGTFATLEALEMVLRAGYGWTPDERGDIHQRFDWLVSGYDFGGHRAYKHDMMPGVSVVIVGLGQENGAAYVIDEDGNAESSFPLFTLEDDFETAGFSLMLEDVYYDRKGY